MPAEPEDPERPRAVTVIGWIWAVVGSLYLLRSLVDLVIWKALQPAAPTLLDAMERRDPQVRFLRQMVEHLTEIKIVQAMLGATALVLAYRFLRLRPGARVGMQAVCWIVLAYVVSFTALWVRLWTSAAARDAGGPRVASHGPLGLAMGLGVAVAIAVGLVLMIVALRSSQVRDAFERPGGTAQSG